MNKEHVMQRIIIVTLSLALAATAYAKPAGPLVQMDANGSVAEQIAQVQAAIEGDDYSEIGSKDKGLVKEALGRIATRMGNHQSVEELSPPDRLEVFNDQQVVNTILTRARADSRMVCNRERMIGSNRHQNVCLTVAQRRAAQEDGRKALTDGQRTFPRDKGVAN